jgi:hypothetical protein
VLGPARRDSALGVVDIAQPSDARVAGIRHSREKVSEGIAADAVRLGAPVRTGITAKLAGYQESSCTGVIPSARDDADHQGRSANVRNLRPPPEVPPYALRTLSVFEPPDVKAVHKFGFSGIAAAVNVSA